MHENGEGIIFYPGMDWPPSCPCIAMNLLAWFDTSSPSAVPLTCLIIVYLWQAGWRIRDGILIAAIAIITFFVFYITFSTASILWWEHPSSVVIPTCTSLKAQIYLLDQGHIYAVWNNLSTCVSWKREGILMSSLVQWTSPCTAGVVDLHCKNISKSEMKWLIFYRLSCHFFWQALARACWYSHC